MGWLIWSHEHDAWWKADRWGYTRDWREAGRYDIYEAVTICRDANRAVINESIIHESVLWNLEFKIANN
jgi:hypothetical protein